MNTAGMIAALCTTTLLLAFCNGEDLSPLFTGHEFSQLVFDDVTQQDLIDTALKANVSLNNDPDTGLTGIFAQLSTEVSDVCLQDTSTFLQDLLKYKNYALQMRASFAQVPSKVDVAFTHRLKFVGNFELCDAVKSGSIEGEPSFDAVPCMMNLHVTDPLPLQYEVGVCIPNSCNEGELSTMVMTDIKQFNKSEYVSFQCSYKEPGSWSGWFMV
ncbi:O-acyltransferase like protein [Holothuria leucospilota]|uniref:O-acyltransferase like protein n=1 Tax=Holothuria leucospilota TaxID=206669 RepID=A0A9Q1BBE5_HOLLE|nr:O-acyltransferase like protein [Holothuria leucospilota]